MQNVIAPTIVDAADAVRAAVAAAYAARPDGPAAVAAVASPSPVAALVEGLEALWARARDLDETGLNALASAAHYVVEHALHGRQARASAILVALALAPDAASIRGGPQADERYA